VIFYFSVVLLQLTQKRERTQRSAELMNPTKPLALPGGWENVIVLQ
jgi:hypothetical protein